MNKGIKTIADIERARARKRAVMDQLEHAEMMRKSAQILLGCTLVRAKCKAVTFDLNELEGFDPDRVTYVDMSKGYGKVIVYIKDTADEEVNLDFLTKRALKAVEAPAGEPSEPAGENA